MNASTITAKTVGPALTFRKGLRDGLPICLGYLSVSFAFGMMAVEGGLPVWAAVLISMTNLTSSGQFAGTALIFAGGSYLEIGITTFVSAICSCPFHFPRRWIPICLLSPGASFPLEIPMRCSPSPCNSRGRSPAAIYRA